MGSIYQRGRVYWVKYYRDGRPMRESAHSDKEGAAKTLLKLREGAVARGEPVSPKVGRITFTEAATDLVNDYKTNGKRSLSHLQRRLDLHLTPFFGGRRLSSISTSDVRAYIAQRQAETICTRRERRIKVGTEWREMPEERRQVSNGEINRELSALKRLFSLAVQAGKIYHRPYIPMLKEQNVRKGFFEPAQYQAVKEHLPAALRPVLTFAYITGWRIPSEVLTLEWRQVDLDAGTVSLDAGTTKNDEARVFPMTADLRTMLEAQQAERDALKKRGIIVARVFHRDGEPIKEFRGSWGTACRRAGCPGRIPHDLRRTAVRNLVRAGVPERVAMQLTGHKTRSVFERYNIVSEGDLFEAARRLNDFADGHNFGHSEPPQTGSEQRGEAVSA